MEDLQYVGARNAAGHSPGGDHAMSDELNGVSMSQENFEEPARSPATHSPDPTSQAVRGGIPVRLITLLSATMVLGMAACSSEETPTEPSASARPELAAAKTYTAVDLGTLPGGTRSSA